MYGLGFRVLSISTVLYIWMKCLSYGNVVVFLIVLCKPFSRQIITVLTIDDFSV